MQKLGVGVRPVGWRLVRRATSRWRTAGWYVLLSRRTLITRLKDCADPETRTKLAACLFGHVGEHLKVEGPVWCARGENVEVGVAVYLSPRCEFWDDGEVRVGSWTVLGPNVKIRAEAARPVCVGERVWLGEGVELLPGSNVGDDAVVCAGTVVAGEVPPRTVVAGNPWRVIRQVR